MPPSMSKKKLTSHGRLRHEKIKVSVNNAHQILIRVTTNRFEKILLQRSHSYDDNASNSSEDFYDMCIRAPTYNRSSKNRGRKRRRSNVQGLLDEDDFMSRDGLSMKFNKLSNIYDFQDENLVRNIFKGNFFKLKRSCCDVHLG